MPAKRCSTAPSRVRVRTCPPPFVLRVPLCLNFAMLSVAFVLGSHRKPARRDLAEYHPHRSVFLVSPPLCPPSPSQPMPLFPPCLILAHHRHKRRTRLCAEGLPRAH